MKYIKYIWILIILYLVCSARTCTENEDAAAKREEQYIKELKDSVKHVFMSDSLSAQSLRSFEITAIDRLNDFADYLKIVSDTSLELKFRQHAFEVAGNLFISGEIKIQKWSKNYLPDKYITPDVLKSQLLSKGMSYRAEPEQINVSAPFIRENDSTYAGRLSFYQKWIPVSELIQSGNINGPINIEIFLIRKLKPFGIQQLKVWDVYLGEIE